MKEHPLHLISALPAKTKPVIAHFGLKRLQPDCGFPIYRNRHISLVLSGVGKSNAAAATALLQARSGCPADALWINLGIAGHGDLPVGTAVLARSITDGASGDSWQLPMEFGPPCDRVELETLKCSDFDYQRTGAFDMKASGFYPTALRFSQPQLVHCLKVISDNRERSGWGVNSAAVRRLIEQHLDLLKKLMQRLTGLALQLSEEDKI